ncbi:MAG TPA: Ger(x)C family spore germination protein [Bacillota bacterium]|nr:Ger(x)C family spore germination protein [Bacillota bacterium]
MRGVIRLWISLISCSLLLSGCWDYTEYEQIEQVSAIGVDYAPRTREITSTIQYIPTEKGSMSAGGQSGGASAGTVQAVHSAKGTSFYEALSKVQRVVPKRLFFGYANCLIFGEDVAKNIMLDMVELHNRTPLVRDSISLVISSGKASETISTVDSIMTASSSQEIMDLINLSETTGAAYPVSLQDFCAMLAIPGLEPTAPLIHTVSKEPKVDAQGGTDRDAAYDVVRIGDQKVAGLAAFNGDKLVGYLNPKESLGLSWITRKKIRAYEVTKLSPGQDTRDALYFRVAKSKSNIKVKLVDGKPRIQIDVSVLAELRKYYGATSGEFLAPQKIRVMEQKLCDSIRSDIQAALNRGQKELKTDIFGFGFSLFREHPQLWRTKYEGNWKKLFPTLPVEIKVKANVKSTGTNLRGLELK